MKHKTFNRHLGKDNNGLAELGGNCLEKKYPLVVFCRGLEICIGLPVQVEVSDALQGLSNVGILSLRIKEGAIEAI